MGDVGELLPLFCLDAWRFVMQPPTGFQSDRNGLEPFLAVDPWYDFCSSPRFLRHFARLASWLLGCAKICV